MNHLRVAAEQSGYFRAVLPGAKLWHLRCGDFSAGIQCLHRCIPVRPGILSPRIVLIDAGVALDAGYLFVDVHGGADVIHGAMGAGAKHVFVARFFKNPRRAAVEQNGKFFQLLGRRRDREAIAAGDIADHHVDILPLHQIAIFLDLLSGSACFIDDNDFDWFAAKSFLGIHAGNFTGVDGFDHHFRRNLRRHAERAGCRPREERDDADFNRVGGQRRCRQGQGERRGRYQSCGQRRVLHKVFLQKVVNDRPRQRATGQIEFR